MREDVAIQGNAGFTVLVVDDEAPIRRSVAQLLARRGFRTIAAEGGEEAVELLRKDPDGIDAVLLDLGMPRMGGTETLTALRALRPHLPVILMSGHMEESVASQLCGRDRIERLPKPFRADALEQRLRALLA